jgi:uncharacterized membrane protein YfcA
MPRFAYCRAAVPFDIPLQSIAILLAAGAGAGVLSGLFGVGGGLILVPVLAFTLPSQGVPGSSIMQFAIGTSLAVIAFHSVAAAHAHHRRQAVLWPVVRQLAPGLAIGSFAGAYVAHLLPSATLKHIVAVGALLIALQMALDLKPKTSRGLPGLAGLAGTGAVIGIASALVGIGGGSLTVPFLTWCSVDMRKAVATSAACGAVIASAGALGFALVGFDIPSAAPLHLGYVYVPGWLALMCASVATSGFGARLAHHWPQKMLKRAFAMFLCCVAAALWLA